MFRIIAYKCTRVNNIIIIELNGRNKVCIDISQCKR
uniref:Uncharacterized protein n=1 Tax=Myoviridae sp. ctcyQ27 TaxID=2825139 RepID=A0A8S5UFD5_9CAUD|nr:MAG TPA: hypothetical protein [Myoviridae sp. ctcyQ27]